MEGNIILVSNDDAEFPVDIEVAQQSVLLRNTLLMISGDNEEKLPLPNVVAEDLRKVISWCEYQQTSEPKPIVADEMRQFDEFERNFFEIEFPELYSLTLAANYMEIPSLQDGTATAIAQLTRGLNREQMREVFNLPEQDFAEVEDEFDQHLENL